MNIEEYAKKNNNFMLMHKENFYEYAKYIIDSNPKVKFQYALDENNNPTDYVIVKF